MWHRKVLPAARDLWSSQNRPLWPWPRDLTLITWFPGPALQAPETSFFPRAVKDNQNGRVVVLPLPERRTRIYVFVTFNRLGNIFWCYCSRVTSWQNWLK